MAKCKRPEGIYVVRAIMSNEIADKQLTIQNKNFF
jgi:hypothetical protein